MVLNTNAATTAVEENGTASTNVTSNIKHYHYHQQEQQQKKRQSIDNSMIRFPKLDECAHFHYEFAELVSIHFKQFTIFSFLSFFRCCFVLYFCVVLML